MSCEKDASARMSNRHQLFHFATTSWPGSRCMALWPDGVVSVHIVDTGGRLRDVAIHLDADRLQELYSSLEPGNIVYLPPVNEGRRRPAALADLENFFAGRKKKELSLCL